MGAEILFYPTAIGWDTNETDPVINDEQYGAWQTIQRGHAVANGIYVVSVNRVGREADQQFWGGSFIANPQGRLALSCATYRRNCTCRRNRSGQKLDHYRTTWPFLRDRRVDSYKPILSRYID